MWIKTNRFLVCMKDALPQKTNTVYQCLLDYWLLTDSLFKNIFDFITNGDSDCVGAVERLLFIHYSVDLIFVSFGIRNSNCETIKL